MRPGIHWGLNGILVWALLVAAAAADIAAAAADIAAAAAVDIAVGNMLGFDFAFCSCFYLIFFSFFLLYIYIIFINGSVPFELCLDF